MKTLEINISPSFTSTENLNRKMNKNQLLILNELSEIIKNISISNDWKQRISYCNKLTEIGINNN